MTRRASSIISNLHRVDPLVNNYLRNSLSEASVTSVASEAREVGLPQGSMTTHASMTPQGSRNSRVK